ncbi:MAG: helix-turn-helix transcriptional regulator [Ilumatobacteraceae bacterium]
MSTGRHDESPAGGIAVQRFDLPSGHRFGRHRHSSHQLAWASRGLVTMGVGDRMWVLPRSRALWIPAGTHHDVRSSGVTTMMGIYFQPATCPIRWSEPTITDTSGLLGDLLEHLADDLEPGPRRRVEAVVFDLLRPMRVATIDVPMPVDERGAAVAAALIADPADDRSLAEWGRQVGASGRTLARVIERETGMGFERWRTHVRIAAALTLLAAGGRVTRVAHDVGYSTPSAFVAAFRRTTGTTPGAYFASST